MMGRNLFESKPRGKDCWLRRQIMDYDSGQSKREYHSPADKKAFSLWKAIANSTMRSLLHHV